MMGGPPKRRNRDLIHDTPREILSKLKGVKENLNHQDEETKKKFRDYITKVFPERGIIEEGKFTTDILRLKGPEKLKELHVPIEFSGASIEMTPYVSEFKMDVDLFKILDQDTKKKIRTGMDELLEKQEREREVKDEKKRRLNLNEMGGFIEEVFSGSDYMINIIPIQEQLNPKKVLPYPEPVGLPYGRCEPPGYFSVSTTKSGHAVRLEFLVDAPIQAKIGFRMEDDIKKCTEIKMVGNNKKIYEIKLDEAGRYNLSVSDSFGDFITSRTFYEDNGKEILIAYLIKENVLPIKEIKKL